MAPHRTIHRIIRAVYRCLLPAVLLITLSAGCMPGPAESPVQPTNLPPTAADTPIPTLTDTPVPTAITPSPTGTPTIPPAPTATQTPIPTPVLTLDTLRRTPPTLMLHKRSPEFDPVPFLADLVNILKAQRVEVVTYQGIMQQPDITATKQGQLFIITIDDISLQAEIDPSIQQMIDILEEANYPAVLGIVTEGKLPNENTVKQLRRLAQRGWELAIHTESHVNLHELEQVSPYGARLEIRTCGDKIFQNTGVRPVTLVLPYGAMVVDLKILYREHIQWAVGINGGEKYRTTNYVYYVGRDGPAGDASNTYKMMMDRFNAPQTSP